MLFDTPAPPRLPVPRLRGEVYPFTLPPDQTKARIVATSEAARRLLGLGVERAKKGEPSERAELTNLAGWGLLLLWREARRTVPASWPTQPGKTPSPDAALALLRDAADAQTDNTEYTRSLGDGYVVAARDERKYGRRETRFDTALQEQGIACLQKVAPDPRHHADGALWFYLGCAQADAATDQWDEAITSLRRAASLVEANGYPRYTLACALATSGDDRQMTQTLTGAGNAPTFAPVYYHRATPRALAWAFPDPVTEVHLQDILLIPGLVRERKRALKAGDKETLVALMRSLFGISKQCFTRLQSPNLSPGEQEFYDHHFYMWGEDAHHAGAEIAHLFPADETLTPLIKEAEVWYEILQKRQRVWQALNMPNGLPR